MSIFHKIFGNKNTQSVQDLTKTDKRMVLFHKDNPVIELFYGENINNITKIGKIYNKDLLPPLIFNEENKSEWINIFNHWFGFVRVIPSGRENLSQEVLDILQSKNEIELAEKCMGLSVTDCYWYSPDEHSKEIWSKFNFFEHTFSEDVGKIIIDGFKASNSNICYRDPISTTNGQQSKRWINSNGIAKLIKYDTKPKHGFYTFESANEVISHQLADALGIPSATYSLIDIKYGTACITNNFANINKEYFPLSLALISTNNHSFEYICAYLARIGIPKDDIKSFFDKFRAMVFIMKNSDYNFGNIGICNNGGKYEMAPVFDFGTSNRIADIKQSMQDRDMDFENIIKLSDNKILQPFNNFLGNTFSDVIKPVSTLNGVNLQKLVEIPRFAKSVYNDIVCDIDFADVLSNNIKNSIDFLLTHVKFVDATKNMADIVLSDENEMKGLYTDGINEKKQNYSRNNFEQER